MATKVKDEWAELFASAEVEETRAPVAAVEVSNSTVEFLASLREPGPNGGRRRARLPLNGKSYSEVARTLRAAAKFVEPPSSVLIKAVYAGDDEFVEEYETETGQKRKRVVVVDGAEPIGVTVTIGDRRGKSASDGSDA